MLILSPVKSFIIRLRLLQDLLFRNVINSRLDQYLKCNFSEKVYKRYIITVEADKHMKGTGC